MARIRTIKPEFWHDEKLSTMSAIDRLTFLGLIGMADDLGRVLDNVKVIDAFVFANSSDTARESLANLSRIGRIKRGKTSSGQAVIQIVNWNKHQRVDKPQYKNCLPEIVDSVGENSIRESVANDSGVARDQFRTVPTTTDPLPPITDPLPTTSDPSLSAGRGLFEDLDPEEPPAPPERDEDFERFWSAFPKRRRTKKQEALRKWKSILKTKVVTAEFLIRRATDYAASPKGKSEYAVMPAVWLNGGMWDDEPEAWDHSGGDDSDAVKAQPVSRPTPAHDLDLSTGEWYVRWPERLPEGWCSNARS